MTTARPGRSRTNTARCLGNPSRYFASVAFAGDVVARSQGSAPEYGCLSRLQLIPHQRHEIGLRWLEPFHGEGVQHELVNVAGGLRTEVTKTLCKRRVGLYGARGNGGGRRGAGDARR